MSVVMQTRCVNCKNEQYGPAVFPISHGEHPCVWCGVTPPVFTDEKKYREALSNSGGQELATGTDANPSEGGINNG